MHKDLMPYAEANLVQIFEAPHVEAYGYNQIFIFDFTYMQVIANAYNYCNCQLDMYRDKLDA